ncbi:hypothetical protein [Shinella sp. NM-101]|uniref:hypothetical protein n=1 Tax=Shinella sp. NM-101 TaxID=2744455 RepID=UPI001F19AE46|nr:hypothetical protein [Shinella sp. NM-101]
MDIGIPSPQRPTSDPDAALVFEAVMRAAGHQAAAYLEDPDPADDPAMPRPDAALAGGNRRAD